MSKWISVKDALPENDGQFLTVWGDNHISILGFTTNLHLLSRYDFVGKKYKRPGWYDLDSEYGFVEYENVKYWMNLPELPKEGMKCE